MNMALIRSGLSLLVVLLLAGTFNIQAAGCDTLALWLQSGPPADFILIDLREPSETSASAVIGTDLCRPYLLPWTSGVCTTTVITTVPKSMPIVVYCLAGGRSAKAFAWLTAHGYSHVTDAGGFFSWTGPTKPVTWGRPAGDLPVPSMNAAPSGVKKIVSHHHPLRGSTGYRVRVVLGGPTPGQTMPNGRISLSGSLSGLVVRKNP